MNTTFFRRYLISLAVLLAICGGCTSMDSMRATVKEHISSAPPMARTVSGDSHQVYAAARKAMEKFGYRFTDGGPAQGRLEGLSRIEGDDNLRSSRQRSISIHLEELEGGRVEIQVQIKEIIEEEFSRSAMPATETSVRDPSVYDAIFDEIERRLKTSG